MAFVTNKYTRPVLLAELKKVSASNFVSLKSLASVISPRAGVRSAKIASLRSVLGSKTTLSTVFILDNGQSNKTFLLNSLRNS